MSLEAVPHRLVIKQGMRVNPKLYHTQKQQLVKIMNNNEDDGVENPSLERAFNARGSPFRN